MSGMYMITTALRRDTRATHSVAWGMFAAAAVLTLTGVRVTHAGTISPDTAACDAGDTGILHEFSPLCDSQIGAEPMPCRDAGLRRTEHDLPAGARGKVERACAWAGDFIERLQHRRRSVSQDAGAPSAPSVDLSRLCRLTC